MPKYDWLVIELAKWHPNGLNLKCDRKRAVSREIELKNKDKCSKPDIIELMAIKLCLNNQVSLNSFYYLQGVHY